MRREIEGRTLVYKQSNNPSPIKQQSLVARALHKTREKWDLMVQEGVSTTLSKGATAVVFGAKNADRAETQNTENDKTNTKKQIQKNECNSWKTHETDNFFYRIYSCAILL